MTTQFRDADVELEFIREFSVGGNSIGTCLSSEDRRERIRVAILAAGLQDKLFRDTQTTYAGVYRQCYGKPLDLRRFNRPELPT